MCLPVAWLPMISTDSDLMTPIPGKALFLLRSRESWFCKSQLQFLDDSCGTKYGLAFNQHNSRLGPSVVLKLFAWKKRLIWNPFFLNIFSHYNYFKINIFELRKYTILRKTPQKHAKIRILVLCVIFLYVVWAMLIEIVNEHDVRKCIVYEKIAFERAIVIYTFLASRLTCGEASIRDPPPSFHHCRPLFLCCLARRIPPLLLTHFSSYSAPRLNSQFSSCSLFLLFRLTQKHLTVKSTSRSIHSTKET